MPQIGWSELLVIAVIAILVIGPKELPIIMKKVGGWIRTVKNYTNQFQNSLEEMTDLDVDIRTETKSKKKLVTKEKDLET
jgi:sec-independent protein translocase protein TatB